MELIIAKNIPS